jgi:NDP-sugar pyrophosphorylase family protein
MRTILICPGERPAVSFLAQSLPLVGVPILGESLLSYWLSHLAGNGAGEGEVVVMAMDRPEMVRAIVGDGTRWGLKVQVQSELDELTPEKAIARLAGNSELSSGQSSPKVMVLDHLPGLEKHPPFRSYACWFDAALAWMPQAARLGRVGLREIQEGVWCGLRTHVAPSARLQAPCWLGDYVRVGPDTVVGPNTVLESGVVVESAAEIRSSIIGPDTFVGKLVRIQDSIAWGNSLIHWPTGSCTEVTDAFLLCSLGQRYLPETNGKVRKRIPNGVRSALTRSWGLFANLSRKVRTTKSSSAN